MSDSKLAYTVDESCSTLSIGRTYLFDLIRRGEISSVKIGRRRVVPAASLEAYLARLVSEQVGTGAS